MRFSCATSVAHFFILEEEKMKTRIRTASSLLVVLAILLCSLSGCGTSFEKNIIGKWYNNNGKCLDVRSDGTWKLEGSYGTGTWKILDDKTTFEFTDYYGDTQESIINENRLGNYIDFGYYGDFYKDAYPTIDAINEDNIFDGVKLNVLGASPFCNVSVDTSNCSNFIKENISFSIKDKYYTSGEKVTVFAKMKGNTGEDNVIEKEFSIEADLQYINSAEEIDSATLNDTISEYLEQEKNSYYSNNSSVFYRNIHKNQEILSVTLAESGFVNLNSESTDDKTVNKIKNAYYCIYIIKALNHNSNATFNYISEVFLYNICKDKNDQLTWNIEGIEKEEPDIITGECYTHKSDWSRFGKYAIYYKSEKHTLTSIYTANNLDLDSIN